MGIAEQAKLNNPRQATSVDELIGKEIRRRRRTMGMSQAALGDAVGVAAQQIQKYEIGANRLSVSRLVQIADALKAPVAWFFQNVSRTVPPESDEIISRASGNCESCEAVMMLQEFFPKRVG